MNKPDIKQKLLDFICRNFMVSQEEIDMESSLVDQGIIDSFGLVEISSFLKEGFSVTTQESEMNRDNFGSVEKLVQFIGRKIA